MSDQFIRAYKYLCVAIFCLVALGGSVRAMNAGLACPDWPLCFGDIIPDYHPQVYFEFLHRVLAGFVGVAAFYLNIQVIRAPGNSKCLKGCAAVSILILLVQIVMGGLTVLLQLHEKVVALHLALGTGFFALSVWIYLTLAFKNKFKSAIYGAGVSGSGRLKKACLTLLVAIYGQILLGGLVASHYAALVCVDFPLCNGQFIPTFQGIIGLHVIHRLGAYTLTLIVLGFVVFVFKQVKDPEMRKWAIIALFILCVQITIGIANVIYLTPPLLTVLHLAIGTLLLGTAVRIVRMATLGDLSANPPGALNLISKG